MGGSNGGTFPCDSSEEFSALFNQLLSPPPQMPPGSGFPPQPGLTNRVLGPSSSTSVSSSAFHFSSSSLHYDDDDDEGDPFLDHNPNNNNNNNNNGNDDYIPAPLHDSDDANNNTRQYRHPIEKDGESSELPSRHAPPPRTSSKRSRAAEFHNLSEKRRRSRINEKMKALQNLIPNSNKTDKASMLDEAIEYLKQLQLQVQMLMMRNGLSLHPMSLPGGLRPMILPQTSVDFDDGNRFHNSIGGGGGAPSYTADEGLVARPPFGFHRPCSISNQSVGMPSLTNVATSDNSSSFQSSMKDAHCSNMSQLLLDSTRVGKNPSPDVS
ncbi:hypothetical protein PIB30_056856 [Stylosanthes scabra]|uniref:BHLH domain-containing protein n=1 Tax=Stylosanthes scabra TaxID=79078 RepID=A0ABU6RJJ7_9FABA|nr:hypothetical protein [Stylosanthes scabra]